MIKIELIDIHNPNIKIAIIMPFMLWTDSLSNIKQQMVIVILKKKNKKRNHYNPKSTIAFNNKFI